MDQKSETELCTTAAAKNSAKLEDFSDSNIVPAARVASNTSRPVAHEYNVDGIPLNKVATAHAQKTSPQNFLDLLTKIRAPLSPALQAII
jgi:hypothetical protein